MIRRLLESVAAHDRDSAAELADAVGLGNAIAQLLLEELCRRGYVKAVIEGCDVACEECALQGGCTRQAGPRIWLLTEKGSRRAGT